MCRLLSSVWIGLIVASGLPGLHASEFDGCSYDQKEVLVRDVVVIGGGASGTYGAIALKDMGRSVAVVEKAAHFDGHVNTYTDPTTGLALEYGVQGYSNDSITRAFFDRFNVPLIAPNGGSGQIIADFATGTNVTTVSSAASLAKFAEQTELYYPDPALGLQLPSPVPADLLLPFREFIQKYSLEDAAYTIWSLTGPTNDLLDQLTVYAIFGCNVASTPLLTGLQENGVITRNNSEAFGKAEEELGSSALLNSHVVAGRRSKDGVSLVVQTPRAKRLILASQVLFSAPIVLDNLLPFNLNRRERGLFSQVYYTAWYTALVTDTGLRPGYIYENAADNTPFNIPLEPYTFRIGASRENTTFFAFYGAMTELPEQEVKTRISNNIRILSGNSTTPRFLAYASHTPFKQQVSAQAVADGFYDQLNSLQGYRRMHYTGNALDASGSSSLFNFTQQLLLRINKAIGPQSYAPSSRRCEVRPRQ
ncbi:MAG: hypothetical protein Q9222_001140 [Ikaeria aurantiellina]